MPRRRTAAERDENNLGAMNNLAVLLALQKRDLNEARRLVEKAIEIGGPQPALLDSRASVYLALGQPQQALSDLQQVVGEDPRPNRQFHLALAYFQVGQEKAAAQALADGRKLGLTADKLHPLERPDYRDLTAKLDRSTPNS
jgi:tetratricopeptide (TPR) repeat protein